MHSRLTAVLIAALSLAACNEAASTPTDSGGADAGANDAGGSDSGATDLGSSDSGVTDAAATDGGGMDASTGAAHVVINEIRESGGDFVELYNTGSAPADLEGYRIADETTDDGGTGPSLDNVVSIPAGFPIAGGGYLVVEANVGATAMDGVAHGCLGGAVADCVQASWGISNTRGDVIYLLPPVGDDMPILTQTIGPMAVADGQSFGRLPNGTGDFSANAPTPGAVNAAP